MDERETERESKGSVLSTRLDDDDDEDVKMFKVFKI